MARPSKLTPEVIGAITLAVRAGNYLYAAAQYAGIGRATLHRWLDRGKAAKSGPYHALLRSVRQAECEAEVRAVAIIARAAETDWRAGMWLLERKHPERWGIRRSLPEVQVPAPTGSDPDELQNLLALVELVRTDGAESIERLAAGVGSPAD